MQEYHPVRANAPQVSVTWKKINILQSGLDPPARPLLLNGGQRDRDGIPDWPLQQTFSFIVRGKSAVPAPAHCRTSVCDAVPAMSRRWHLRVSYFPGSRAPDQIAGPPFSPAISHSPL